MQLDLTSFNKAINSLTEVLDEYKKNSNVFMRDACIQRFEYTYELAWKMLKRYLEITSANPAELDEMSFQNLIRTGSEKGLLLHGWDKWSSYRKARSTTSHVYDEKKAEEVFATIPGFLEDVKFLQKKLQANLVEK
jgi:nucleotidyltransferase substrate binding protein (TIGR01987 family)